MRALLIALAVVCLCASGADKKKKPPDIQVMEIEAHRDAGSVKIDGRVRALAEKPVTKMVIYIDFFASGNASIDSKKFAIDEELLETGDEATFHVVTDCPPRAIQYGVRAFKNGDAELSVANNGPFPILE